MNASHITRAAQPKLSLITLGLSILSLSLVLAACSGSNLATPATNTLEPTLEQIQTDNDTSINLAGTNGGFGKLVIRKIYDDNQNGRYDPGEAGIPNWGVRITSLFDDGTPSTVSDVQVTPEGAARWRGVVLNVIYGKYIVEELEPVSTKRTGLTWKVTGERSKVVSVTPEARARAVEFAGTCFENATMVNFPKLKEFDDWKCRAKFDLLPRIRDFTATPISNGSSTLDWNVLDFSNLEIDQGVGAVTPLGFAANKSAPAKEAQVFTLKVTNGFGSSTAKVTVTGVPAGGFVGEKGKWTLVGQTDRLYLSARTLPSGKVLLQGGPNRGLLDPSTGKIKALPDSFRSNEGLIINGSQVAFGDTLENFETGEVETLAFVLPTLTNNGKDVVRLSDSKVFAIKKSISNLGNQLAPTVVEVYDLTTRTVKQLSGLPDLDASYGLTKLRDGQVAYFASRPINGNELRPASLVIVNPETGGFTQSASWQQACGPFAPPGPFELLNGDLLFPGGVDSVVNFFKNTCVFRRSSLTLEKVASADFSLNSSGPVFGFANGQVLKVSQTEIRTEFYDVPTQQFIPGPSRPVVRSEVAFAQLLDGRVLALGGFKRSPSTPFDPAFEIEIFTP